MIEHEHDDGTAYGVVDSNCARDEEPKALTKLKELGADELSFVCLTHPHHDHFRGLYDILTHYVGRVGVFYTHPLGDLVAHKDRLKKLARIYHQIAKRQDDPEVTRRAEEFVKILRFASYNFLPDRWQELSGGGNQLSLSVDWIRARRAARTRSFDSDRSALAGGNGNNTGVRPKTAAGPSWRILARRHDSTRACHRRTRHFSGKAQPTDGVRRPTDSDSAVELYSIQPPNRAKGQYFDSIDRGTLVVESLRENEISTAINIIYAGVSIILGGDATKRNWLWHRTRVQAPLNKTLQAKVVKLPHHGSKLDCDADTLGNLFDVADDPVAVISSNGLTHPHQDVLHWLIDRGIQPRCTNLAARWSTEVIDFKNIRGIEPTLGRWLYQVAEHGGRRVIPCKGDITVSISNSGDVEVRTEFDHACPCGTEISALFAA